MKIDTALRENILQYLLRSEFGYKTPVKEAELAERFGVSLTPVREVLNNLEEAGFVERKKRKGTYLKSFSIKEIKELYELRGVLEGLAARLLCDVVNDDTVDQLEKLSRQYEAEEPKRVRKVLADIDYRFHSLIVESCRNDRLVKMVKDSHVILKILKKVNGDKGIEKKTLENPFSHSDIVNAIENRDSVRAEHITRKHVEWAKESVVKRMIIEGADKLTLC